MALADRSQLYKDNASGPFFGFNRLGANVSQGAIGRPLIAQLLNKGHPVVPLTHTPEKAQALFQLGVEPTIADVFDLEAYGFLYGSGTWFNPDGDVAAQVRKQQFPMIGNGDGVWSWLHIERCIECEGKTRTKFSAAIVGMDS